MDDDQGKSSDNKGFLAGFVFGNVDENSHVDAEYLGTTEVSERATISGLFRIFPPFLPDVLGIYQSYYIYRVSFSPFYPFI